LVHIIGDFRRKHLKQGDLGRRNDKVVILSPEEINEFADGSVFRTGQLDLSTDEARPMSGVLWSQIDSIHNTAVSAEALNSLQACRAVGVQDQSLHSHYRSIAHQDYWLEVIAAESAQARK
jgi:hypothetical protein